MPCRPATGFTLFETLMASTVLAVCVLAITQLISAGQAQTYAALHQERALTLAEALIEEMVALPYNDPQGDSGLGPDDGESARASFDNVDDFHGYSEDVGEATDAAGELYDGSFARFGRSVTCTATTLTINGVNIPGLSVIVTITDDDGLQWSITRFFPQESS